MNLLGVSITRVKKAAPPASLSPVTGSGWLWPWVRESFLGAWQQNTEVSTANVLTESVVYSCVTLIAKDIGKLRPMLMAQDASSGVWEETTSPAFSPFLRKPNRYQNRIMFLQNWMTSKLIWGNTYILKERDNRGVVVAGYILDPQRVTVLVSSDGAVWYDLRVDNLAGIEAPDGHVVVPAKEIIHDVYVPLYHPLIGVSPITAAGLAAMQALRIEDNSAVFFGNGARPGGVLTAPGMISDAAAARLKAYFDTNFSGNNAGKVAVLGDGLAYEQMTMNATDAQLIEQLKWTAEQICRAFHIPPYMIGVGPMPTYNNIEALNAQYYTQCLQNPIEMIEVLLDEGLGLVDTKQEGTGRQLGIELDLADLLRMDSSTRMTVAEKALKAGMTHNEVRINYHGLKPVTGGDSVLSQQQNFSLEALAERDENKPFAKPAQATPAAPATPASTAQPAPTKEGEVPIEFPWKLAAKAMTADRLKQRAA
jgi:HK97 family phage portal protein